MRFMGCSLPPGARAALRISPGSGGGALVGASRLQQSVYNNAGELVAELSACNASVPECAAVALGDAMAGQRMPAIRSVTFVS